MVIHIIVQDLFISLGVPIFWKLCQSQIFSKKKKFISGSCLRKILLALSVGESRRTGWFIYLHLAIRMLLLAEITLYHSPWALFGSMCIKIFPCHDNFTERAWNHSKRTRPQMQLWRTKTKTKTKKAPI